jgi:hypothetical protein
MYSQISNAMVCCAHDHCIHCQASCASARRRAHRAHTRPHARSEGGGPRIQNPRQRTGPGKFSRRPTSLVFPALALLPKTFDPLFFVEARNFPTLRGDPKPKPANSPMPPIVRLAPRPQPPSRPIKSFDPPAPGPHHNPVDHPPIRGSNKIAADAVRKASDHNGKIDPRQQRNSDPSNID